MYCWWGNELIFQSMAVAEAAYEIYNSENAQHVSKALILIMLRAQRPLYVTAGKFVPLSYSSFVSVSFSFNIFAFNSYKCCFKIIYTSTF